MRCARPFRIAPGWALALSLGMLLVLGHVCGPLALVHAATLDAAPDPRHHAASDHPHDPGHSAMSCDSAAIPPSTGLAGPSADRAALDLAPALQPPLASPPVAFVREDAKGPPGRLPLFLLHASLLI